MIGAVTAADVGAGCAGQRPACRRCLLRTSIRRRGEYLPSRTGASGLLPTGFHDVPPTTDVASVGSIRHAADAFLCASAQAVHPTTFAPVKYDDAPLRAVRRSADSDNLRLR